MSVYRRVATANWETKLKRKKCVHTRISYVFKCIIQTHTNETTDDVPRRHTPKISKKYKVTRPIYTSFFRFPNEFLLCRMCKTLSIVIILLRSTADIMLWIIIFFRNIILRLFKSYEGQCLEVDGVERHNFKTFQYSQFSFYYRL